MTVEGLYVNIDVIMNTGESRFEATVEGCLALIDYRLEEGTLTLVHTEVPKELGGQGVGSRLARVALDYAMTEGFSVVPQCPFIAAYIERHPEYRSLVADD